MLDDCRYVTRTLKSENIMISTLHSFINYLFLFAVASTGNRPLVDLLIHFGVDVTLRDKKGELNFTTVIIHYTCHCSHGKSKKRAQVTYVFFVWWKAELR